MIHFGDVQKIDGAKIPKVDIITFGAPCQDLSIAGKRAGMKNTLMGDTETTRSGLFFEAIRIIKEMREDDRRNKGMASDELIRPRYAVYENVPGAFSSNKGEDFHAVLEETAKIADKNAVIPKLEGGQRWTPAGCIMGDGWSIAWRVHDAQFWGVPQRRKRISLVADFGGPTAPEILFERKSVSGNPEQSGTEGQSFAGDAGLCAEESSGAYSFLERGGKPGGGKGILVSNEQTGPLLSQNSQAVCSPCLNSWDVQSKHIQPENGIAEALYSGECRGGGGESYVMQGIDKVAETLDASYYKGCGERQGKERTVVYGISSDGSNAMRSDNPHSGIYEADTTRTLDNNGGNPACNQGGMMVVMGADLYNTTLTGDKAASITSNTGSSCTHSGPSVVCIEGNGQRESHKRDGYRESETMYTLNTVEQHAVCVGNGQMDNISMKPVANSLDTMHDQQAVMTYGIDRASFNQGKNAQYDFSIQEEVAQTIVAKGPGG